jgi:hypothetical protein
MSSPWSLVLLLLSTFSFATVHITGSNLSRWCLYDPADSFFKNGGSPRLTKEDSLEDAVQLAKSGRAFKQQVEQVDRELE